MLLVNTALRRLPLTSAMVYLVIGWVLGPAVMDSLRPDPRAHATLLGAASELGLLISLFAVGMQLRTGLRARQWWLPAKLAFVSLGLTVLMVSAAAVPFLGLNWGWAIVLGGILAPTDPVLASALQPEEGVEPNPVIAALAAEGGLNDGAAYPFVMLGLAVAGLGDRSLLHWLTMDFAWATVGGIGIGFALGALVGKTVVVLRGQHGQALGLDVFLGLGLIGTSYGLAHFCGASGFLAVFSAGLALGRVREYPAFGSEALEIPSSSSGHTYATLASHSHHASSTMRGSVVGFNEQIEKICEMALVMLVGAMLPYAPVIAAVWWFVPLLLLLVRPLSVLPSYLGERVGATHLALASWFGIRGIGSLFYLLFVLSAGGPPHAADILISLTLWTIAASIVLHGLTARPLMRWVSRREAHRRP
jgi:NhaP-type Na+/H+ or K+/H+ antiporter